MHHDGAGGHGIEGGDVGGAGEAGTRDVRTRDVGTQGHRDIATKDEFVRAAGSDEVSRAKVFCFAMHFWMRHRAIAAKEGLVHVA